MWIIYTVRLKVSGKIILSEGDFRYLKIRFVINPAAGAGDRAENITEIVSDVLSDKRGIFEVRVSRFRGDGHELAKEAARKGYDMVFAYGGDGTVNEVASALVGTDTVLGIIPAGSGNGLARALSIPFNVEEAIALAFDGRVREIDAGSVAGRFFFSTSGLGFDAHLSALYDKRTSHGGRRGVLPYIPLGIKEFFSYRAEPLMVKSDVDSEGEGGYVRIYPFVLTVANTSQYGGGAIIAPGAKCDDGLFDLCVLEEMGIIRAAFGFIKLFTGKIDRSTAFTRVLMPRVEILREKSGVMHVDGEPFLCNDTKLIFTNLPKALKVMVPAEKESNE